MELRRVGFESPRLDGRPNLRHELLIEIQVVDGVEVRPQDFIAPVEVPQVAAAIVAASVAAAVRVDRARVLLMHRITDVDRAGTREQMGVAGVPRASLVILAGTLATFNLPVEGIAVILGVDTLMDMCRTSVNLLGNCLATAVVARWEGVDLRAVEAMADAEATVAA